MSLSFYLLVPLPPFLYSFPDFLLFFSTFYFEIFKPTEKLRNHVTKTHSLDSPIAIIFLHFPSLSFFLSLTLSLSFPLSLPLSLFPSLSIYG